MIVSYPLIGKSGLVRDESLVDGPADQFTEAQNVRFRGGMAELISGHSVLSSGLKSPLFLLQNGDALDSYWLIACADKVYASYDGAGGWADITRASGGDYSATADTRWNGGVLNGVAVINNGVDVPQAWVKPSSVVKIGDLSNWTPGVKCKVIRPHKNYLIALNITKSTLRYPHMVKWSHPADPGAVPVSWDHTDPTKDCGENDLPGADHLIDGGTVGDVFMLYKERSTHLMQFIGGQYIFRFQQVSTESGILGVDCWTELNGIHVVLTSSDLVMVSTQSTLQSIVNNKMRRWLFQNMDSSYYGRSFIVKQQYFNEVWCCFPIAGESTCTHALVWNHKDNVFSVRELPNISHAAAGPASSCYSQSWTADTESWDSDLTVWNSNELTPKLQRVVMADPGNNRILLADSTSKFVDQDIDGLLERSGITFGDPNRMKIIKGIRPKFYGAESVYLSAGGHDTPYGEISWGNEVEFNIDSGYQADMFVTGRYLAIRIRSDSADWRLERVDFDIEFVGNY